MNYAIFRKPSRYIGNEVNMVRKEADLKVALCFPDTYEIGMSHLGLKILYAIINNIPDASAERVFAPWVDMESYLRDKKLPLRSLEFQRPLREFDIVGFTLQYELSYTNILNMMDLGGIPLRSAQRGGDYPLVIAGGPCSVNPLTLAPFIDAFVIGDGEEVVGEIIDAVSSHRNKGSDRPDLLSDLSRLEGVYVPAIHDTATARIKKRIVKDLDNVMYHDTPVLPYTALVHDRVAIEVARGCTRGCRFCQAGMTYRPLRERSLDEVLSLAGKSIAATGYDEVSFASLSTGDYSCLLPLIQNFNKRYKSSHISVSLPSLRVGSLSGEVLKELKSVRKTGFTIAPEAGTARLRDVINKNITDEEYGETLRTLFSEGWKHVKLYFMIGLPTETIDDIRGLIDMAVKAVKTGKAITRRRVDVNVGVSSFVPKPHTPFQWAGQDSIKELRDKQDHIKFVFRKRGISFKGPHVEISLLESVFSRGDSDSSVLLEEAWKLGCRFDAWSEHFDFDKWVEAGEKAGIDLHEYASRAFNTEEALPWDFIDTGVTKAFLLSEYNKAMEGITTLDCRETCHDCGLGCSDRGEQTKPGTMTLNTLQSRPVSSKVNIHSIMRVKFSKTGHMRYLSHNELISSLHRAMRRAMIPVAYSVGFNPHPKLSFGPALPSGVEGMNEFFDIELTAIMRPEDFLKRTNSVLPEGLRLLTALLISRKDASLSKVFKRYEYEVTIDNRWESNINFFMDKEIYEFGREKKTVDIRPMVETAKVTGNTLKIMLADTDKANVRLFEILRELLKIPAEEVYSLEIKRTGLYGYNSDTQRVTEKDNSLCRAK